MREIDSNARLAMTVAQTTTALRQYPGPRDSYRHAFVENKGLYRWYYGDTTDADNDYVLEPASGGSVGRWKIVLPLIASNTRFTRVPPSGDTTGATDGDAIQTVLTAGKIAVLESGIDYYVDARLTFTSNSGLVSLGPLPARLNVAFDSVLTATDRENAVLLIKGTTTATVSTTLGADLAQNATSLTSAGSVPTAMAGGWLRVLGVNPPADFLGDSSDNTVSELVQVATAHTASTTVALQRPTFMHHNSLQALVSITPVTDVVIDNIRIIIDSDNTTIATGLCIKDSVRVQIGRFHCENVSLAVLSDYGSQAVYVNEIWSHGTTNCTLLLETAHGSSFANVMRTNEGDRTHSLGYPQHEVTLRAHCAGILVSGGSMTHGVGGIRLWGGVGNVITGLRFSDLDITEACERDPEGDDMFSGYSSFGVVLDSGPPRVDDGGERSAEFGFNNVVTNIQASNCRSRNKYGAVGGIQAMYYIHDQKDILVDSVSYVNIGVDPSASGPPCSGMLVSDSSGVVSNVVMRGVDLGIRFQNVSNTVRFENVSIYAHAGTNTDSLGGAGIVFAHTGQARQSPSFGRVALFDFGGSGVAATDAVIRFENEFTAAPDRTITFDELVIDGLQYQDVRPASCVAFSGGPSYVGPYPGQFGTINTSQPPDVAVATGTDERNVVFATIPNNGWCLIAFRGAHLAVPVGTPKLGDVLIAGSDGYATIGAIPSYPDSWFMATGQWIPSIAKIFATRRL